MSMLNFHIPDDQMDAMMAMYADDEGFCYWKFLNDIEPPSDSSLHYEYSRRISRLRELFNNDKKPHEIEPVIRDVEGVMNVVKREVGRSLLFPTISMPLGISTKTSVIGMVSGLRPPQARDSLETTIPSSNRLASNHA